MPALTDYVNNPDTGYGDVITIGGDALTGGTSGGRIYVSGYGGERYAL
jgi:glutamate synthase domain-containing protein 3